ncbi:MAG: hypothetical protein ACFFE2_09310 [Candidatus Thorarchaeota archaeon]
MPQCRGFLRWSARGRRMHFEDDDLWEEEDWEDDEWDEDDDDW